MSLSAIGIVLALIVALVAFVVAYTVFVQYGRMLVRMESLEGRLAHMGTSATPQPREPALVTDDLPEAEHLRPGALVPSFRLPRLGGGDLVLEAYRGRRVLLVMSDPECIPCKTLLPRLEESHRRSQNPAILLVSRGDAAANEKQASELGLTFPIALQRGWEVAREYGMVAAPVGYLIDAGGRLEKARAVGVDAIVALAGGPEGQNREKEEVLSRA